MQTRPLLGRSRQSLLMDLARTPAIVIGSSDVEEEQVIETSEPERHAAAATAARAWTLPLNGSRSASGSSTSSSSRKPVVVDDGSGDSDIELVAARLAIQTKKSGRSKAKGFESGFGSAKALLTKERVAKELKEEQDRKVDSERKARSVSPYFENALASVGKGKGRAKAEDQSDFDDESIEALPPPLRAAKPPRQPSHAPLSTTERHSSVSSDSDAAVSSFKKQISSFRAPGEGRQTPVSAPMFAPTNGRFTTSLLGRASSHSDTSTASSSAKPTEKKVKASSSTKPPPMTVATELLNVMTKCPICALVWPSDKVKTASSKLAHVRKCASVKGYREDTVQDLSYRQVGNLKAERDEVRRNVEANQTLFENVVSRKGKDVLVVGVEEKSEKRRSAEQSDGSATVETAVLYTQGGSGHSQATHTQVQRDLDKNIKINQRVDRGDFISLLRPSQGAVAANVAPNGVGAKQWQKASELLAARAALSSELTGPSTSLPPARLSSTLENYATSRFRLSEKAKRIIESRSASSASSADEETKEGQSTDRPAKLRSASFERTYRQSMGVSLADMAIAASASRSYDMWGISSAERDTETPAFVVSFPLLGIVSGEQANLMRSLRPLMLPYHRLVTTRPRYLSLVSRPLCLALPLPQRPSRPPLLAQADFLRVQQLWTR